MTLHGLAEFLKKASIVTAIGTAIILILVIVFRIGGVIVNLFNPPKILPANEAYGKLPPLEFPPNTTTKNFTYTIDTLTGTLPEDIPDRVVIYPLIKNPPDLLSFEAVKEKVLRLGFLDDTGNPVAEIPRGGPNYEWDESGGLQRKIFFDIVSLNFKLTSEYLTSNSVLRADAITTEDAALNRVITFLDTIGLLTQDLDIDQTRHTSPPLSYHTKPQPFRIAGGELVPEPNVAKSQVIRVDLYQKDIAYKLTAGLNKELNKFRDFDLTLPVLYSHPPNSTMNFLIASSQNQLQVVEANFAHQAINLSQKPGEEATYPIKTADEAFAELKSGKAYIAAYKGNESQILIKKVYLAYYLAETNKDYLMPIIVFEGEDGFFAYISAIEDSALE